MTAAVRIKDSTSPGLTHHITNQNSGWLCTIHLADDFCNDDFRSLLQNCVNTKPKITSIQLFFDEYSDRVQDQVHQALCDVVRVFMPSSLDELSIDLENMHVLTRHLAHLVKVPRRRFCHVHHIQPVNENHLQSYLQAIESGWNSLTWEQRPHIDISRVSCFALWDNARQRVVSCLGSLGFVHSLSVESVDADNIVDLIGNLPSLKSLFIERCDYSSMGNLRQSLQTNTSLETLKCSGLWTRRTENLIVDGLLPALPNNQTLRTVELDILVDRPDLRAGLIWISLLTILPMAKGLQRLKIHYQGAISPDVHQQLAALLKTIYSIDVSLEFGGPVPGATGIVVSRSPFRKTLVSRGHDWQAVRKFIAHRQRHSIGTQPIMEKIVELCTSGKDNDDVDLTCLYELVRAFVPLVTNSDLSHCLRNGL